MEVKPVSKRSVSEEIVRQIKEMIGQGTLRPGDRLPAERALAEKFGVSRTTVREAIKVLAETGNLESRQGAGTFVREIVRPDSVVADMFSRSKPDVRDVFETRKMIEPEIAAIASGNALPDDIDRLEAILHEQEAAINAGRSGADCDQQFHELLAEMSGNQLLRELVSVLHDGLTETRAEDFQSKERQKASLVAHWAIVVAIKQGHGMQAERAMRDHLEEVERIVFSNEG